MGTMDKTKVLAMKAAALALCIIGVGLMGFQCPPGDGVSVTIDDEAIGISVVEAEGGIEITNTGDIPVIVFVKSPEGEQQFELEVGESVVVTGITKPIEVLAVGG